MAMLTIAAVGGAAEKNSLYNRRIVVEASDNDKLTFADRLRLGLISPQESADELAYWLEQMTGKKFEVSAPSVNNPVGAIYLLRTDSALVATADKERLKDKGLDAFIIRGDANKLQIIANDMRGLMYGVYSYLEQLGVRWLMCGANWTVVPTRGDITLAVDRLVAPAFFSRDIVPSGWFYSHELGRAYTGFPADKAKAWSKFDKEWPKGFSEFEREWKNWTRHMRNGGQVLGKSMGEAFVAENRAVLQEHPEYLAKIDGKYTPLFLPTKRVFFANYVWDTATNKFVKAAKPGTGTHELNEIAKLNAGNPAAVELFANWILAGLRENRKGPQGYAVKRVSVEPSDGAGEGNNYDELKAQGVGDGSESDQEFFIANACARKVRAEFPDVSVIMYAYALRSDPPSFPLEPNFVVQPCSWRGGKKTARLSYDEWLAAWKAKGRDMATYDFWSIPDWDHDEPTFNYLDMAKKLRDWYSCNIKGVMAETTSSGGAMAIGQYVASHLMWDLNLDDKALIEDWYDNAFGPAKAPMKRMMERWARGYRPISTELGMSYHDIDEAERLATNNPAVLARVDDYAKYLHYLRLRDELLATADGPARDKKISDLSEYFFDIEDSRMLCIRIFDQGKDYKEFHRQGALGSTGIPPGDPDGPGWARVHKLSHADVAALVADGLKTYPLPDFAMKTYTGKLVPLKPIVWQAPAGDPWGVVMGIWCCTMDLQMPEGLAAFPLRVSRTEDSKVTVSDDSGRMVFTREVTKSATDNMNKYTWDEMSIPLAAGHYQVSIVGSKKGVSMFQTWKGVPLVLWTFNIQKQTPSPRLYFYVPRGLPKIAIYFPNSFFACAFETPVYLPNGERAKVESRDGGKLMVIKVPTGMDGKVWSLDRLVQFYQNFETLTIPQAFSLSPETLMVPRDALENK